MHQLSITRASNVSLSLAALLGLVGCGGSNRGASRSATSPLDPGRINLVFVVSEDLANHAPGDVNPATAGLTSQGLQRALANATFLRQSVLGGTNVTGIYALEAMTHLQTAGHYPDMNGLMAVQQFALLNQITLSSDLVGGSPYTGQNFPINASYAAGAVPPGAVAPASFSPSCQGLDFNDTNGNNETLISGIIAANAPGFYVFSAPWTTVSSTLAKLKALHGYNLPMPSSYAGPNIFYALSIAPAGSADLAVYDSQVHPASSYPILSAAAFGQAPAPAPTPAGLALPGTAPGAQVPAGINTNETIYFVRHAEAHPHGYWSDSNYVGAGQWRALYLPIALQGRIDPDQVWSMDTGQSLTGTVSAAGVSQWSNLAPALTVQPFAIANGLPFHLLAGLDVNDPALAQRTADFFFTGGTFSNHKLLLGWTFQQIPLVLEALFASYFPNGGAPATPAWTASNYDSMWVVTLDGQGNLTADFTQYQGIESSALPATAPVF